MTNKHPANIRPVRSGMTPKGGTGDADNDA